MAAWAAAIIFIASMPLAWSKEQLSSRECEDLGFTGLALCSDCHTLAEYIKDQGDALDSQITRFSERMIDSVLNLFLDYYISIFRGFYREFAAA